MSSDPSENRPDVERPADHDSLPAGLASGAFVARLRLLLQQHRELNAARPDPPLWGLVQLGCLILGAVLGYQAGMALVEGTTQERFQQQANAYVTIFLQEHPLASLGCTSYLLTVSPAEETASSRWLPALLLFSGIGLGLAAPGLLLRQIRRGQRWQQYQRLEDALRLMLRHFPDEIEHSGGIQVLADAVELEALICVLESKYPTEPRPPLGG